jgi:hypothetical protein
MPPPLTFGSVTGPAPVPDLTVGCNVILSDLT